MLVQVLFVDGCPNVDLALARLIGAASEAGVTVEVDRRAVGDEAEAKALGMRGSPTILIDGIDVTTGEASGSLSCRLYRTGGRIDGAPSLDELVVALSR
jgi:hypothetical protein